MTKVLFICLGNICRSPMAKFIFADMVRRAGLASQFEIDSAATSDEEQGNPLYPPARDILRRNGIACEGHQARQMTTTDYDHFDLVIAMDESNLRHLRPFVSGDPLGKVSLLLDHTPASLASYHHRGISDPWFTHDFAKAYDDIHTGCSFLLKELTEQQFEDISPISNH